MKHQNPFKLEVKSKEVYRKIEIMEKYNVSIGTVNNRIRDKIFIKIVPRGSRLVYIRCEEVDNYFTGGDVLENNETSIVTNEIKDKVKILYLKKRRAIEILLKQIEVIEKSETKITKKKKVIRTKLKRPNKKDIDKCKVKLQNSKTKDNIDVSYKKKRKAKRSTRLINKHIDKKINEEIIFEW